MHFHMITITADDLALLGGIRRSGLVLVKRSKGRFIHLWRWSRSNPLGNGSTRRRLKKARNQLAQPRSVHSCHRLYELPCVREEQAQNTFEVLSSVCLCVSDLNEQKRHRLKRTGSLQPCSEYYHGYPLHPVSGCWKGENSPGRLIPIGIRPTHKEFLLDMALFSKGGREMHYIYYY